jgi:diacylglycerol kinase (ATP)
MRVALLVNPTSGKGRGAAAAVTAAARLRSGGADVTVVRGRDAAEAAELAAKEVATGTDALVTVGGDGMVHLGVNAVAGTPTRLGIVAAGTGNDLASALGLPVRNPVGAADVVLGGHTRAIDAVRAGERWYGCVLGAGFDSAVNERANQMDWPRGDARYVLATLATLPRYRPRAFRVVLDGEVLETEAMLVAVANASSYGGGMKVAPGATLDDGLLDVVILGPLRPVAFLRAFPRVFRGTHVGHPQVTVRQARVVTVDAPGVVAYADGERFGPLPLTLTCEPGALTVLVPPRP